MALAQRAHFVSSAARRHHHASRYCNLDTLLEVRFHLLIPVLMRRIMFWHQGSIPLMKSLRHSLMPDDENALIRNVQKALARFAGLDVFRTLPVVASRRLNRPACIGSAPRRVTTCRGHLIDALQEGCEKSRNESARRGLAATAWKCADKCSLLLFWI